MNVQTKIDFLVIEDDFDTVSLLVKYFESRGYTCKYARSVKNGLKMLQNYLPSLILLDILLPDKKGYEIIKTIRSDPVFNDVLIYFLTAIPRSEAMEKMDELSVDGVFIKPFSLSDFEALFKKLEK